MKTLQHRTLVLVALVLLASPPAFAAGPGSSDATQRHERELANCRAGLRGQNLADCLRDANAAYEQARHGGLGDAPDAATLRRNAEQRCSMLPGDDRRDCLARMQGQGTVSGSVDGGGILRELVTQVPAPATPR